MLNREMVNHVILDFMQMREFARDPFIVEQGQGLRVKDVDGKEYIDGLSGVFVTSIGHGNPAVIAAMKNQLDQLSFAPPLHGTNPPALALAEELLKLTPADMNVVKFFSGGSEATEAALKLARQYHVNTGNARKYKVLSHYGSYHGATMGALAASGGWERKSVFEPLGGHFLKVHPPECSACPFDHTYGSCNITCASMVERAIVAEDPETISAIIMSPAYINHAGFVVPPQEFFPIIRAMCDKHNIVLIFDEVITGFGRMGATFGAEYHGVWPDILCCGKGMSGGYVPLAATILKDRIHEAFLGEPGEHKEFHHGHTYGGNPLACAAGLAALRELTSRNMVANAREVGAYLQERLRELGQKHPIMTNIRGAGLLQGISFAHPATGAAFPVSVGKLMDKAARERGMIMRCGHDYIAFAPPLVTTRADIDEIIGIADACVAAVTAELLEAGLL